MADHTSLNPRYNETDRTARLTDIQTKQYMKYGQTCTCILQEICVFKADMHVCP